MVPFKLLCLEGQDNTCRGDLERAIPLCEAILADSERVPEPDHPQPRPSDQTSATHDRAETATARSEPRPGAAPRL
jgi:hypothetical protein